MIFWLLLGSLALPAGEDAECRVTSGLIEQIRNERVTGSLKVAEAQARRLLTCPDIAATHRLSLQLELAKVLDRIGLHTYTRPVEEAHKILLQAEAEARSDDVTAQARVALALAEYFYRAEMRQREFPLATERARQAERLFRQLEDPIGETDAVHRLGLIEMQKRQLEEARNLFDRSLEISKRGPSRPIFLSDYHRHVGFVDMLSGDQAAAIGHFEASLTYRNEADSKDYGLFARATLGSALTDDGRPAEARPYLEQALRIARELPSPFGELRAIYYLAEMHEALANPGEALQAYRQAKALATELGVTRFQEAAQEASTRLTPNGSDSSAAVDSGSND